MADLTDQVVEAFKLHTHERQLAVVEEGRKQVAALSPRLSVTARNEDVVRIWADVDARLLEVTEQLEVEEDRKTAQEVAPLDAEIVRARTKREPADEMRGFASLQALALTGPTDVDVIDAILTDAFDSDAPIVVERVGRVGIMLLRRAVIAEAQSQTIPAGSMTHARRALSSLERRWKDHQDRARATSPVVQKTQALNHNTVAKAALRRGYVLLRDYRAKGYRPDDALAFQR
jgi:hypothetical protein